MKNAEVGTARKAPGAGDGDDGAQAPGAGDGDDGAQATGGEKTILTKGRRLWQQN